MLQPVYERSKLMVATEARATALHYADVAQTDAAHDARRAVGDVTRRAILAELARREAAREPAPSWAELGAVAGVEPETAGYHLKRLKAAGLVTFQTGKPRTLVLTDAGRAVA